MDSMYNVNNQKPVKAKEGKAKIAEEKKANKAKIAEAKKAKKAEKEKAKKAVESKVSDPQVTPQETNGPSSLHILNINQKPVRAKKGKSKEAKKAKIAEAKKASKAEAKKAKKAVESIKVSPLRVTPQTNECDVKDGDLSFMEIDTSSIVSTLETSFPKEALSLVSAKSILCHFLSLDLVSFGKPQRSSTIYALSVLQTSSTFSQSRAGQMFVELPDILAKSQKATVTFRKLSPKVSNLISEKGKRDELVAQRTALSEELTQLNISYGAKEEVIRKLKAEVDQHEADLESLLEKGEALKSSIALFGPDVECLGVRLMAQKDNFIALVSSLQDARNWQVDCCMRWNKLRQVIILLE